jgi:hypothetical protein
MSIAFEQIAEYTESFQSAERALAAFDEGAPNSASLRALAPRSTARRAHTHHTFRAATICPRQVTTPRR